MVMSILYGLHFLLATGTQFVLLNDDPVLTFLLHDGVVFLSIPRAG